jgi:hypothetical protein
LFKFQTLYRDEEAVLVVTNNADEFYIVGRTAEVGTFNGTKLHGLVPIAVAKDFNLRKAVVPASITVFSLPKKKAVAS